MRILIFAAGLLFAAQSQAQNPIGQVESSDAALRGSVVLDGTGARIMSGAQITAGPTNASLKLARGGDVQVCAGSNISVTSSNNGRETLFGLNSGAMETHYNLASSADTIITPDFRLLLAGPGAFHFAISTGQRGDMCVQSLPGNASSIIVNEQLGEGTHQVKPGEQVTFHNGRVNSPSVNSGQSCGCPAAATAQVVAKAVPKELGFPEQQSQKAAQAVAAGQPAPQNPGIVLSSNAPANPGQVFMQVDAPIVFRGEEMPVIAPAPTVARAELPPFPADVHTAAPKPPTKRKWYQKLGSAFAAVFGGGHSRNQ